MAWTLTDGSNNVVLDYPTIYDQGKTPRRVEVPVIGRNWNRLHHDGASALRVEVEAVLCDTTPSVLEDRVNRLRLWQAAGTRLTLSAPGEAYYNGLAQLTILGLAAPREIGRLTNRRVSLVLERMQED